MPVTSSLLVPASGSPRVYVGRAPQPVRAYVPGVWPPAGPPVPAPAVRQAPARHGARRGPAPQDPRTHAAEGGAQE